MSEDPNKTSYLATILLLRIDMPPVTSAHMMHQNKVVMHTFPLYDPGHEKA